MAGLSRDDSVACLIPARAGSKRIPNKNLALVGATSLLERAIQTALTAFGAAYVSTDSDEYAAIARKAGATVPALRPPDLASDSSTMDDVIQHALTALVPREAKVLVVAQATSPFTTSTDLREVVTTLLAQPTAKVALTARVVDPTTSFVFSVDQTGFGEFLLPRLTTTRTQDVGTLAVPTGGAYAASISELRTGRALLESPVAAVLVPPARAIDIDDESDLEEARRQTDAGGA